MNVVRQHLRPEFLNRLDEILLFHPLSMDDIRQIVRVQMATLQRRLHDKHPTITVQLDDTALDWIARVAYDPNYGARPLRRFLEQKIVTQLSRMILTGQLATATTTSTTTGTAGTTAATTTAEQPCIVRISLAAGGIPSGGTADDTADGRHLTFHVERNTEETMMHVD